jgi:hypothetical protein
MAIEFSILGTPVGKLHNKNVTLDELLGSRAAHCAIAFSTPGLLRACFRFSRSAAGPVRRESRWQGRST